MAKIDKFLQKIFQTGSDRLIMTSGKRAVLSTGGKEQPVTTQPVNVAQIQDLLLEIAPHDKKEVVGQPGQYRFRYDSPSGAVNVQWARNNGSLQVQFLPDCGRENPEKTPTPPAAAAGTAAIDALFRRMIDMNCSDLHLSSGNPPLVRKDGVMAPIGTDAPITTEEARKLFRPITPDRNWKEFQETHDTDFAYELTGIARFRCNLFQDRTGMGGVFRQIPTRIPTAEELGLNSHILDLCNLSKGLVLVTGPTGSGKSTTLAAMISYIHQSRAEHIITIEDPIEFVYPKGKCLINQRQVGLHTEGFKRALRAALREDPDIVLVGEMRDLETVKIALETAETGHLVFGTLHTNTAASTIDRIIDQFPADEQCQVRTMLSESLKGVIAQTLCRKIEGGRVAAHELLIVNSAVANLIREAKTFQIPSIMQTGRGIGMMTMNDALLNLLKKKLITPEEALGKSVSKTEFRMSLERHGIKLNETPAADPS
ncbi:MAG: type IV pilus twitching motility protein PilT [Acidobacteria bacterium]|nr:type IV pilus twitching motility protein PilT [Acidobacteriota bacterium]